MHTLSQTVLERYQVRKTKKQKTAFIAFLKQELSDTDIRIEESGFLKSRNIVIGDIDKADFILGAHYDTQPVMPFPNFIAPKNFFALALYFLAIIAGIMAITFGVSRGMFWLTQNQTIALWSSELALLSILVLMLFGKANKHTANDNTSGVITLLEALQDDCIRSRAAFVFFDHEEVGTFGSMAFAKRHKNTLKNKTLINFDCVSDGDHIMLVMTKRARQAEEARLREAFLPTDEKDVVFAAAHSTLYPSDQMNFRRAVGVAAFKKKKGIGYYMNRIHTSRDTVFDERNIRLIVESLRRLCDF